MVNGPSLNQFRLPPIETPSGDMRTKICIPSVIAYATGATLKIQLVDLVARKNMAMNPRASEPACLPKTVKALSLAIRDQTVDELRTIIKPRMTTRVVSDKSQINRVDRKLRNS